LEYAIPGGEISLSAIRTVRVLRPLRAINRVPSMRILVMLLLDTLPMLGNVLLLCFFVFFIFGIVGVQLWKGMLRNRCYFQFNYSLIVDNYDLHNLTRLFEHENSYYQPRFDDSYVCTEGDGMATCSNLPPFINNSIVCNATILDFNNNNNLQDNVNKTCINWNYYYTFCKTSDVNPYKSSISFDNIGYAWVAIFQVKIKTISILIQIIIKKKF
jgi:voltage-dependent calcium channel T type alpha-1G